MDILTLEDSQRIITPEQAETFRDIGIKQISIFSWYPDPSTGESVVGVHESMAPVDWSKEGPEFIAAFDMTELMYMMEALPDYYICGRIIKSLGEKDEYIWWADEINQVMYPTKEESPHMSYGKHPAEAMAGALIKAINAGKVPINWPFFDDKRMMSFMGGKGKTPPKYPI
jgi:hypothetical protein